MTPDIGNISKITTNRGVYPLLRLTTVSSTNDYAIELLREPDTPSELIIVADHQTKGKGQMGRRWHTSPGNSLNLSYIIKNITYTPSIFNMAIALGVLDGIRDFPFIEGINKADFNIKWPNDIVLIEDSGVRKIAGILIENSWRGETQTASIIGVGVNLDTQFSKESVSGFNLMPGNLNDYLCENISALNSELPIINSIQNRIHMLSSERGDEIILEDFNNDLFGRNTERLYTIDNKPFKGTLLGIEKDGLGVFSGVDRENIKVQSSNVVWSFMGGE
jgi:BirA family transcriptional regulator, biotin operon repressor / biotin---[acetyl-CoA-carboxylase] ligase